jgi:hypothetical protein
VHIPPSVRTVREEAFTGCAALTDVSVSSAFACNKTAFDSGPVRQSVKRQLKALRAAQNAPVMKKEEEQ